MFARLAFTLVLLALAGCGFEPMYGGDAGASLRQTLAGIDVAPIPERTGLILRQNLQSQIGSGSSEYQLSVQLNQEEEGSGFRTDEATTRINIILTARYELRRLGDDELIVNDVARSFAAYDVVESEFATLTARQDALRSAAEQLSRMITARLATHFRAEAE